MMRVSNFTVGLALFGFLSLTAITAHAGVLSDAPPSPLELQVTLPQDDTFVAALKIINHADHAMTIQRGIEIDQLAKFKWVATPVTIQAIADCKAFDPGHNYRALIRIEAGETLDVAWWHGSSCGSQCFETCPDFTESAAGSYRFVVVTAEGERLPSPSFKRP